MANQIGLYYPFIEFRDDSWVKFAALYWDKLGRIVPPGYKPNDSKTISQLSDDLEFIVNFEPSPYDLLSVSGGFRAVIREHKEDLIKHYNVAAKQIVKTDVRGPKFTRELKFDLIHEGLAISLREDNRNIGREVGEGVRMHSKLAFIYMNYLAEEMASVRLLNPVADDLLAHFAVNGFTFDRLVQVLLESDDSKPHLVTSRRWYEIEAHMATVALKSVLPKDIANVPVKKIIKLRKNHRDEMTIFQNYIHEFVSNLEKIQDIEDSVALKAHLEIEYEKNLRPQLDEFKKLLRSLNIDTVEGLMNIRVGIPPFLATTAEYLAQAHTLPSINPIIAGAGALAFSVLPVIRRKRREIGTKALSTPAAYLLYAQEGLEPASLISQITQKARKITYGV